jgi:hypothetical protein
MPHFVVFLTVIFAIFGLDFTKPETALACKPIARVVNFRHPNYKYGDAICLGVVPRLSPSEQLRVVCLNDYRILIARKSSDLKSCSNDKYGISPTFPLRPNGVTRGKSNIPVFDLPLGSTFRGTELKLRWSAVPQTVLYRVSIDNGDGDLRNVDINQNQYILKNLSPGKSYLVTVRSLPNVESQANVTIKMLAEEQSEIVNNQLRLSETLQIPTSEILAMKIGVLSQLNLLQDSIDLVNKYLSQDTQNPLYIRKLGDLYVMALRPSSALNCYKQYYKIAKKLENHEEIADATRRIEYVSSYPQL